MESVEAIDAAQTNDCDHQAGNTNATTTSKSEIAEVGDNSTASYEHRLTIHDQTVNISVKMVVENKTILLILLVATLTLGFGIIEEGEENGWHEGLILLIATVVIVLFASFHKSQKKRSSDANFIVESQIDKLDDNMQLIGLAFCILCLIVSLLWPWDTFGKRDDDKESKHPARHLLKLLIVFLVGVTQKVPFVSVAIRYFNDHTLSGIPATSSVLVANMGLIRTLLCVCTEDEMEVDKPFISGKEVKEFRDRRIDIVMVSSRNVSFALQSEVITDSDPESSSSITGEDFRNLTDPQRLEIVGKIRVMRDACQDDRLLLVKALKKRGGEVVEFEGQRTDEARPTLRARGSADSIIIIWDGSIGELISMVDAGKSMYANIQRFLQHFLIMFISSSLINLLGTVAFGDAPLTTWDLLWVNLVEVTLGGYVSLTKPSSIDHIPVSGKPSSLITSSMTINIWVQVLYQIVCCMVLLLATGAGAMVSNSFILCQFFNLFNAREVENKNIFRGMSRHVGFWIAGSIFIGLQVGLVRIEELFGYGAKLEWKYWVVSFVIGSGSWLVDWLGKCIYTYVR